MVPTPVGLIDHVTAVLLVFVTVAVKFCDWPAERDTLDGLTLTAIGGMSVTVADADFVVSVWLVAVIVTASCELIVVGAV
jgi:hypothetical protein